MLFAYNGLWDTNLYVVTNNEIWDTDSYMLWLNDFRRPSNDMIIRIKKLYGHFFFRVKTKRDEKSDTMYSVSVNSIITQSMLSKVFEVQPTSHSASLTMLKAHHSFNQAYYLSKGRIETFLYQIYKQFHSYKRTQYEICGHIKPESGPLKY